MRKTFEQIAVLAAPAVFVVLWASGFIGAKLGLPYAEPLTFLALRMVATVFLLAALVAVTQPVWPSPANLLHNVVAGILVHGVYLGGVFVSMQRGLPAGLVALVIGMQPLLTSTLANLCSGNVSSSDSGWGC